MKNMSKRVSIAVWAPFTLERDFSGDKVNEVERVRVLCRRFDVCVFVLISIRNIIRARELIRFWFGASSARVIPVPFLNLYGFRLISSMFAAIIVDITLAFAQVIRRFDLVICRGAASSLPIVMISRMTRTKCLYNALSYPFAHVEAVIFGGFLMQNRIAQYVMKCFDYFVLRNADFIAVANKEAAIELIEAFGHGYNRKIIFLPFPIPEIFFEGQMSGLAYERSKPTLVYYGSVNELYDFAPFVQALRALNKGILNAAVMVFTSSRGKRALTSLVTSQDDFMTIYKPLARSQLPQVLRGAAAVVVPLATDRKVGVPTKAIEAMALGVPVIISNPCDPEFVPRRRNVSCCFAGHARGLEASHRKSHEPRYTAAGHQGRSLGGGSLQIIAKRRGHFETPQEFVNLGITRLASQQS